MQYKLLQKFQKAQTNDPIVASDATTANGTSEHTINVQWNLCYHD